MHIRFDDHAAFHRAAAGMALGSFAAGVALHFITGASDLAPLLGGLTGVAAGAAWGYGRTGWRLAAAGLAAIPLAAMALAWPALAISASVASLGLAAGGGRPGARARSSAAVALAAGAAIGVLLLAMWCSLRVDTARQMQGLAGWWTDGAAAAAMGIVAVIAVLPRHVALVTDPVRAALRGLPAALDPEVQKLCARAVELWSGARERLAEDDPGRELVRDGVLKTLEVAIKSAGVKALDEGGGVELAARMADLDQRIAAATDAEVRTQYTAARAALEDQRRYREHIANGRERLVARMHNHIAALEKFQLAATGLVAARAAAEGATAVAQLAELSSDVAASGEALAELELAEPGAAAPPA